MSSCCSRKRSVKDLLFLPMAVVTAFLGLGVLLAIEMSIAYAIGVL
tara:strand:- start:994 stop:1131 length:138 start_codon:yes stop_codon:yes gene_type:complete